MTPEVQKLIAEVNRRLDAFTHPSFDRTIVEKLLDALSAQSALLERAGKALEPFAQKAERIEMSGVKWVDDYHPYGDIALKYFRLARSISQEIAGGK